MEEVVKVVFLEGEEIYVVNIGWDGGDWYFFLIFDNIFLYILMIDNGVFGFLVVGI